MQKIHTAVSLERYAGVGSIEHVNVMEALFAVARHENLEQLPADMPSWDALQRSVAQSPSKVVIKCLRVVRECALRMVEIEYSPQFAVSEFRRLMRCFDNAAEHLVG